MSRKVMTESLQSRIGRSNKRKGKIWERKIANLMKGIFGDENVRRGYQSRCGTDEPDVVCPVWWIEAKHGIKVNVRTALLQATEAATDSGKVPVAICKDNRKRAFVVMWLEDFVDVVSIVGIRKC